MIRRNKWKLLVSSVIILLPIVAGLILWNDLPQQMAIHWGLHGAANRWSSKAVAVFGIPVFLLVLHWVCFLVTNVDPKNKNQTQKVFELLFWICPVISLYACGSIYAEALGKTFDMEMGLPVFMGLMFVVIGNYLPKCKQNHTIGIKVIWALRNEENWNATHRFGGKLWVVGGLLLMLCALLPGTVMPYAMLGILALVALLTVGYSYVYHRKHEQ